MFANNVVAVTVIGATDNEVTWFDLEERETKREKKTENLDFEVPQALSRDLRCSDCMWLCLIP